MLTTLIELQRLKRLDRTGWVLRGFANGTESVAAHSFGVGVTAMLLADKLLAEGVRVNVEKVLRMALLHDWSEARVGDMPRTATEYFGSDARKRAETAAFRDLVRAVDSNALYAQLYDDYEQRNSLEARLVKVADVDRSAHRGARTGTRGRARARRILGRRAKSAIPTRRSGETDRRRSTSLTTSSSCRNHLYPTLLMTDLLSDLTLAITWRSVLIGAAIFAGTFVVNLAIVSFILIKLPANYFSKSRKTKFWSGPRPLLHAAGVVGKNIGGVLLVRARNCPVAAGRAGPGSVDCFAGRHAAGFSGEEPVGTEVVE
jgi:putative hydrolase of HD superfamily